MIQGRTRPPLLASSLLLSVAVCLLGSTVRADEPKPAATYEVETVADIPYYQGKDAHPLKHKLDLYLPKGKKDFPVLFFIHGGAWSIGDKSHFGLYSSIGRCFARQGIGVLVPNYRLSPTVTHPGHIQDVAKAFAWTYKNIKKYGGRPDEIFVSGHSAGGHLAALLATDDTYLKAEGLSLKAIKGAIPLSGVYSIPEGGMFDKPFGKDPKARKQASPINYVRGDAPPFLIVYGDADLPACDRPAACAFCKALKDKKCQAEVLEVKNRNHMTILFGAGSVKDPVGKAMLAFIQKHLSTAKGE